MTQEEGADAGAEGGSVAAAAADNPAVVAPTAPAAEGDAAAPAAAAEGDAAAPASTTGGQAEDGGEGGGKRKAESAPDGEAPAAKSSRVELPLDVDTALDSLPAEVKQKLQQMYDAGQLAPSDLDHRAILSLNDFAQEARCATTLCIATALQVLDHFIGGTTKLDDVRNKSAYLAGVVKRFRDDASGAAAAAAGYAAYGAAPGAYGAAPGAPYGAPYGGAYGAVPGGGGAGGVDAVVADMFARGALAPGSLDDRAMEYLRRLPEASAVAALNELAAVDLTNIRNVPAYFKTICRRHAQMLGLEPPGPAMAAGPGASMYGGGYPGMQQMGGYPGMQQMGGYGGYPGGGYPGGGYAGMPQGMYGAPQQYGAPPQQTMYGGYDPYAQQAPYGAFAGYGAPAAAFGGGMPVPSVAAAAAAFASPAAAAGPPSAETLAMRTEGLPLLVAGRVQQVLTAAGMDFDQSAWNMLRQLPEQAAIASLDEVLSAAQSRGVRNASAYFMGIARKHMSTGMMPGQGTGSGGVGLPGQGVSAEGLLDSLQEPVRERLGQLVNGGLFTIDMVDYRTVDTLRRLEMTAAMTVLEELAKTDVTRVRNLNAYLMGIMNRYTKPPPPGW